MTVAARGSARLREQLTRSIEVAVIDELAEAGYGRFSVGSVARRAGVGKAAIYRRWATKTDMIAGLLAPRAVALAEVADTGSLRGDLEAFVETTRTVMAAPRVAPIVADLFAESLRDPELGTLLRENLVAPRRARVTAMLQRAVDRGEASPELDRDAALDLLAGPFLVRLITTGEAGDADWAARTTALLLRAVGRQPPGVPVEDRGPHG